MRLSDTTTEELLTELIEDDAGRAMQVFVETVGLEEAVEDLLSQVSLYDLFCVAVRGTTVDANKIREVLEDAIRDEWVR